MLQLPSNSNEVQIGIDEAGRGCLAFDVCAAAVVLPSSIPEEFNNPTDLKMIGMIKDSKKMTAKQREKCEEFIKRFALCYAVRNATPAEIDEINILKATMLAMHRAIEDVLKQIKDKYDDVQMSSLDIKLMVDGDRFQPYFNKDTGEIVSYTCIPEGDNIHMNIAAASILSKVTRDRLVIEYCQNHPDIADKYGFLTNKAYGTKKHMDALKQFGIIDQHRKSFAPVAKNNVKF